MNGHLPPLSALRAFEAAARLKSFSKAAAELNVTPAAISHQIHALEADLGVSLFRRLNRSIELTASARVLLPGLSDAFAGISASDDVVDLTRGDFDIAIRYGTGRYPGLAVELLLQNEVFPACSPRLLEAGPPLSTPEDLRHHALIHDQAVDRDPLAPTWAMWLKAAGVASIAATSGLTFSVGYMALDAAIAGHGVALAYSTIAAADLAAGRLVR